MIIEGRVLCPTAEGAIKCEGQACTGYTAIVRTEDTGELHVRCTKA